jgi:hypothetical protein
VGSRAVCSRCRLGHVPRRVLSQRWLARCLSATLTGLEQLHGHRLVADPDAHGRTPPAHGQARLFVVGAASGPNRVHNTFVGHLRAGAALRCDARRSAPIRLRGEERVLSLVPERALARRRRIRSARDLPSGRCPPACDRAKRPHSVRLVAELAAAFVCGPERSEQRQRTHGGGSSGEAPSRSCLVCVWRRLVRRRWLDPVLHTHGDAVERDRRCSTGRHRRALDPFYGLLESSLGASWSPAGGLVRRVWRDSGSRISAIAQAAAMRSGS